MPGGSFLTILCHVVDTFGSHRPLLLGGGNLGSIQAGMLEALLEADVRPDIIAGTSVGDVNQDLAR